MDQESCRGIFRNLLELFWNQKELIFIFQYLNLFQSKAFQIPSYPRKTLSIFTIFDFLFLFRRAFVISLRIYGISAVYVFSFFLFSQFRDVSRKKEGNKKKGEREPSRTKWYAKWVVGSHPKSNRPNWLARWRVLSENWSSVKLIFPCESRRRKEFKKNRPGGFFSPRHKHSDGFSHPSPVWMCTLTHMRSEFSELQKSLGEIFFDFLRKFLLKF